MQKSTIQGLGQCLVVWFRKGAHSSREKLRKQFTRVHTKTQQQRLRRGKRIEMTNLKNGGQQLKTGITKQTCLDERRKAMF